MRPDGDASSLASVETALFSLITGHGAPATVPDASALVLGDARASADERLHVYTHMYQARLVEALEAQFTRLARRLGCGGFDAVVARYVTDHPSRNPSLRLLGQHLPAWLDRNPAGDGLADLARLEWARADVFDDVDEPVLTMDAVRALPPENIGALPLRLIAAHRLVTVDAGAIELWDAADDAAPTDFAAQGPTSALIWRQGVAVYHRAVDAAERAVLAQVAVGTSFGALCESLAETLPAEEAIQRAFAWLSTWLADELLAS